VCVRGEPCLVFVRLRWERGRGRRGGVGQGEVLEGQGRAGRRAGLCGRPSASPSTTPLCPHSPHSPHSLSHIPSLPLPPHLSLSLLSPLRLLGAVGLKHEPKQPSKLQRLSTFTSGLKRGNSRGAGVMKEGEEAEGQEEAGGAAAASKVAPSEAWAQVQVRGRRRGSIGEGRR
jgi:hypothetical protein